MRRAVLARSRAVSGCAFAALAAGLAGCTAATSSSVTVTGKTLTIYASVPLQTGNRAQAQDVLDAEQLALQQAGAQVGSFKIKFVRLGGNATEAKQITDNARTAIQDSSTIAYLGELDPGASGDSIPITNDQDILQVSPTDTALQYTQSTAAVPGAPGSYYGEAFKTYGYTFGRVVPSAALEAKAQVQEMQTLGVTKLYVADDGSQYGNAIALAVKQDASPAISVVAGTADAAKISASGAGGLFYGASDAGKAASFFNAVAAASASIKLFGPSALDSDAFAAALGPAAAPHAYISAPGFLPADLTAAGAKFVSDFKTAYGHDPATGAIFGYEAMAAVLGVLREAGSSASDRSVVVRDFFAIKNRSSVLGTYSIRGGDPTIGPFVFSHLKAGKLVPFKSVPQQG